MAAKYPDLEEVEEATTPPGNEEACAALESILGYNGVDEPCEALQSILGYNGVLDDPEARAPGHNKDQKKSNVFEQTPFYSEGFPPWSGQFSANTDKFEYSDTDRPVLCNMMNDDEDYETLKYFQPTHKDFEYGEKFNEIHKQRADYKKRPPRPHWNDPASNINNIPEPNTTAQLLRNNTYLMAAYPDVREFNSNQAPAPSASLFPSNDNVLTSRHHFNASNTLAPNQLLAPNLHLPIIPSTHTSAFQSYVNVAPQNNGTPLKPKGTTSQPGKPWQKTETKLATSKKNESTCPWNDLSALIKDMSLPTQSNASGPQNQGFSSRSCGSSPTNVNSSSKNAGATSRSVGSSPTFGSSSLNEHLMSKKSKGSSPKKDLDVSELEDSKEKEKTSSDSASDLSIIDANSEMSSFDSLHDLEVLLANSSDDSPKK